MPDMNGWEFRTAQRSLDHAIEIPTIIMSAAPDLRARTQGLDAAAVLAKPFDLDNLLATIRRMTSDGRPDGAVCH